MFDPGACVSILLATPHLIQRARKSDRKLTAAGSFVLKSYGVVEETIIIGFGPKAWTFYVVETHHPLLGKDFFQHNFLTWKYVPDDGSRTIKLRVTDETTGNSIRVTDATLAHPCSDADTVLVSDASNFGCGVSIMQSIDKPWRPIQGRRQRGSQWCPAPHLKSVPHHFTFGPLVATYIQYCI